MKHAITVFQRVISVVIPSLLYTGRTFLNSGLFMIANI
jgi:hypothetical protein